jgi:DNA-binding CsgD family transcriptional regulator
MIAELGIHRSAHRSTFEDRHRAVVHSVNTGVHWLHEETAHALPAAATPADLSERQRQILQELLAGESPKRIAIQLGLTSSTVRTYIKHLYRRLSVSTRGELLSKFIAQNPVEQSEANDLMTKQ